MNRRYKGGKCAVNTFNSQTYSIKPKKSMDEFFQSPDARLEGIFKDPNKTGKKKCIFYTEDEYLIVEFEDGETITGDMAKNTVVLPTGIYITHDENEFNEKDYEMSEPVECIRMQENKKNPLADMFFAVTTTGGGAGLGMTVGGLLTGMPLLAGGLGALGAGSLISGMIYYGHYGIVVKSINKDGNYYMTFIQVGSVGTGKGAYDELVIEWRIYYNFDEEITDTNISNLLEKFHIIDKHKVKKKGTMGNYRRIIDKMSTESIYNPTPGPKQLTAMRDNRKFDPSARYHNCVTVTNYILDLLTKDVEIRGSKKKKRKKRKNTKKKKKKSVKRTK